MLLTILHRIPFDFVFVSFLSLCQFLSVLPWLRITAWLSIRGECKWCHSAEYYSFYIHTVITVCNGDYMIDKYIYKLIEWDWILSTMFSFDRECGYTVRFILFYFLLEIETFESVSWLRRITRQTLSSIGIRLSIRILVAYIKCVKSLKYRLNLSFNWIFMQLCVVNRVSIENGNHIRFD